MKKILGEKKNTKKIPSNIGGVAFAYEKTNVD